MYSQFRQPIRRSCATLVTLPRSLYRSSSSCRNHLHRQNPLASATFFDNLIFGRCEPHHKDRLPQIYPPEETLAPNSDPLAGMRVFFVRRLPPRVGVWVARGPSFERRTSPIDSSDVDQPFCHPSWLISDVHLCFFLVFVFDGTSYGLFPLFLRNFWQSSNLHKLSSPSEVVFHPSDLS